MSVFQTDEPKHIHSCLMFYKHVPIILTPNDFCSNMELNIAPVFYYSHREANWQRDKKTSECS